MSYSRPRMVTILSMFVLVMAGVLYHQYNSQQSLAVTIENVQQDFIQQRQDISTLVGVMEEMRLDKRRVEDKLDSTRKMLDETKESKDSLYRFHRQTVKHLQHEILQMRRMQLDSTISPLEYRYRSNKPSGG